MGEMKDCKRQVGMVNISRIYYFLLSSGVGQSSTRKQKQDLGLGLKFRFNIDTKYKTTVEIEN